MNWRQIRFVWSIALLAIGVVTAAQAQTTVYNLTADWTPATSPNPNAPWSLRYGTTVLTNYYWLSSESAWVWDWDATTNPSFAFETAAKTGWNDGAAGDVVMQGVTTGSAAFAANGNGLLANVAWTAPSAGTITVSGRTWDAYGNRPGAWTLFVSGTQMAGGNIVANSVRGSAGVTFGANLVSGQTLTELLITAGQEVIFNQYGATTGVEMSVAFTAVPEPSSSVAFFGIAVLSGAIMCRRRTRRIRRERLSHETRRGSPGVVSPMRLHYAFCRRLPGWEELARVTGDGAASAPRGSLVRPRERHDRAFWVRLSPG